MREHSQSRQWAKVVIDEIHTQLERRDYSSFPAEPIQERIFQQLYAVSSPDTLSVITAREILKDLESLSELYVKSEAAEHPSVSLSTRRLYSDCRLLHSLLDLWDPDSINDTKQWEHIIARLDMAIIVSGAPGENRLDIILEAIRHIQLNHLPHSDLRLEHPLTSDDSIPVNALTANGIPCLSPPSLSKFATLATRPFIIRGFLNDWPALQDHPWKSPAYLLHVSGRGRVVPVEVGSDYRADDWDQTIIPWETFLVSIGMISPSEMQNVGYEVAEVHPLKTYYLAQHTLLTQFPELRSDIVIPDYVYVPQDAPAHFPNYRPPGNEEQLVINAWLGPRGTVSPAHVDPYFNCYGQVVGRKTVWLASPEFQQEMYPFAAPTAPHTAKSMQMNGDNPVTNEEVAKGAPSMGNTSRVDVFSSENTAYPLFDHLVRPHALSAVLETGDMLFIPPGWWHAMRSEDISFSVSMWF